MRVYRIRLTHVRPWLYAQAGELDPQNTALATDGTPKWTHDPERAKIWTKEGGAEAWRAWYLALGEPAGEAEIDEYEDPARTIGDQGDD